MLGQSGILLFCIQMVAWVRMTDRLADYIPVETAFKLVVEGQEICGMCDFVQAQTSLKEQSSLFFSSLKLDLLVPETSARNLAYTAASEESKWKRMESRDSGCPRTNPDPPPPKVA